MKITKLILLFFLPFIAFGQTLEKNDSIKRVGNTNIKVVYLKNKTAIYEGNIEFQKGSKNVFFIYDYKNLVIEYDLKAESFYVIHFEDYLQKEILGKNAINHSTLKNYFIVNALVDTNSNYRFQNTFNEDFEMRVVNNFLVINRNDYNVEEGSWVYSGVYNLKKRKWALFSNQNKFHFYKDYIFQLNADQSSSTKDIYNYYSISSGEAVLKYDSISTFTPKLLAEFYEVDSIAQTELSSNYRGYYETYKNGKKGLLDFSLGRSSSIIERVFLEPEYDFIYTSNFYNKIIALKGSQWTWTSVTNNNKKGEQFTNIKKHFKVLDDLEMSIDGVKIDLRDSMHYYDLHKYHFILPELRYGNFEFEVNDGQLLIADYSEGLLIEKVDENGELMYNIDGTIQVFQEIGEGNSGVYDLKNNQWLITPDYITITYTPNGKNYLAYSREGFVTIYDNNGNELGNSSTDASKDCIDKYTPELISKIYGLDSVSMSLDDDLYNKNVNAYITYRNNKKGLLVFEVDTILSPENRCKITQNEILFPIYDFIYYSDNHGQVITLKENEFTWYSVYYNRNYKIKDSIHNEIFFFSDGNFESNFLLIDGEKINLNDSLLSLKYNSIGIENGGFGFHKKNEQIVFTDFLNDEIYEIINENGFISYDEFGDILLDTVFGKTNSGVYDLHTNQPIIQPKYKTISQTPNNQFYLAFDKEDLTTMYDRKGKIIKDTFQLEEYLSDHSFLERILLQENQELLHSNCNTINHRNLDSTFNAYENVYVFDGQQYQLINPKNAIYTSISPDFHDFAYQVEVSNGLIDFYIDSTTNTIIHNFKESEGLLQFLDSSFTLQFYSKKDRGYVIDNYITVETNKEILYFHLNKESHQFETLSRIDFKMLDTTILSMDFSIIRNQNVMIINNPRTYRQDIYQTFDDEYEPSVVAEHEGAEIWKLEGNIWNRKVDQFAKIKSTKYGYLATTGKYEVLQYDPYEGFAYAIGESVSEEAQLILLNEDFLPLEALQNHTVISVTKSQLGYELECKNKGLLLMNEQGILYSSSFYDEFLEESGVIYGIRHELEEINEWGEVVYDENGNVIFIQEYVKEPLK